MNSFEEVFDCVKKYCLTSGKIIESAYNIWIEPISAVELNGSKAILFVQSDFQKGIILQNFESILKDGFEATLGFAVDIEILTEENMNEPPENLANSENYTTMQDISENEEYDYTFDTFIVGRSNEFAYAACTAVAKDNNGSTYNPLFIHGPSGLGKTHLMNAISNEMKKNNPNLNIIYVTGETFANELIDAIRMKRDTTIFHEKYRNADVLLVDDIQFIAGRESTQEEFFHTFNELYKEGKQIVLTSDKPPKDIKTLEERIRTRFESGLIADVSTPDFETRMAIIRRKAEALNINIPDDVCEFIANRLKTNIRQLEGAVKKMTALRHFAGNTPTMATAQSVIRDILNDDQPVPITVEKIISDVAEIYNVTVEDIKSNKRSSQISLARKVAIYVVREITQMSLVSIGHEFGNRDHSTIVYSINSIEASIKKDKNLKQIVDDCIKNIKNCAT
ncbi:MAG: chromosomal replication initiator protein DnaA [Ruminococcus sp.]|nr:chromosomal replication initiator protein DnaA [Ruminococcus sp.]